MTEEYLVLDGAESFFFEGNDIGVLLCHGFTGTTQSMKPLGEAYAKAGYTVCGPRLKGHGTHYEDMERTKMEEWMASVEEGLGWLKDRCETIFVTGLSMGGTLTLYLAEKYSDIKGIVLINAAVELPQLEMAQHITDTRFLDAIGSDIKLVGNQELAYMKTPVRSIKELIKLTDAVSSKLNKVSCPALLFVSMEDHVVPPTNTKIIYDRIGTNDKKIITLKNSYHVATLDNDQGIIISETLAFIKRAAKSNSLYS